VAAVAIGIAAGTLVPGVARAAPSVRDACAAPSNPHTYRCLALIRTDRPAKPEARVRSAGDSFPSTSWYGYSPAQLQSAYGLTSASALDGSGATVAIIDAYNDPNAESDLATYRSAAGLPPCTTQNGCFRQLNQNGNRAPLPASAGTQGQDSIGWDVEESLDVDMVSAICPNCKIDLIEAKSNNDVDLDTAASTGATLAGFESNSYGGGEYFGESAEDVYFDHPGTVITASAGDDDYGVDYPAASPGVVAVGGTSLTQTPSANARGWTETAWGPDAGGPSWGTGSGCSAYETKPAWQTDPGCPNRTVSDVAADADPDTGVAVYDTFDGAGGWQELGGTSASSPIIASVYALAGAPKPGTSAASYPYGDPADLYDISTGTNSDNGCAPAYLCTSGVGYDGPTGVGTPNGIGAFMADPPPKPQAQPPTVKIAAPTSGHTFTLGQVVPTTFSCSEGAGGPGLASCEDSNGTVTSTGGTGTLNTSAKGSFTYSVKAKSSNGTTSAASIDYVVVAKPAPTADLAIRLRGPRSARAGSSFVERLTVANAGPAAANLSSTMSIPGGLTAIRAGGGHRQAGSVRWSAQSLRAGHAVTYAVRFRVGAHVRRRVLIRATTRSAQLVDPNPADDAARTAVDVRAPRTHHHAAKHRKPHAV
jgi:subtilase family serine protease